jgi:hypothetical protein
MRELILQEIFDRIFDEDYEPTEQYVSPTKEEYLAMADEELLRLYKDFVLVFCE